ncbi:MAG TPA: ATP-binding domain-containing protein [Kineosporiaceae bacterium]|nr:ATP-binding domain-containing protein [Kineosporiaceae bacterium]
MSLVDDEHEVVLVDWRAPAAEGFYRATPSVPGNVVRRRQIRTRNRDVVAIDDEVFEAPELLSDGERSLLDGESALFAALNAGRTGRMHDIVATIQAEQDRIVRAELPGILVVQGGPGTGKTVVALHRAAYLLYTYRARLAKRGVLIIGPNPTFMRYIDQVLPALGENDVLLCSIGQLYPGVDAVATESPEATAIKGDLRMVQVLASAVHNCQQVPEANLEITVNRGTMHEEVVRLDRAMCEQARATAWEAHEPHNQAREIFIDEIIEGLGRRVMGKLGMRRFRSDGVADTGGVLRSDPDVAAAVEALWPGLRPREFLAELLASPERLAAAAPQLRQAERDALLRVNPGGWTPADVPLLDEVAELLGPLRSVQDILGEQAIVEDLDDELAYAAETLEELGVQTVNAEQLLTQHEGEALFESTADRARADRTWTFGHVIVDEAQELSPMVWRVLMRRCPSRSMTVVGDIAQTGSVAGARSWADVLDPYAKERWRQEHLSLNYRATEQIMDVAADVLREIDAQLIAPAAVRRGSDQPWSLLVEPGELLDVLPRLVKAELSAVGVGRLAIIAPQGRIGALDMLLRSVAGVRFADDPDALDAATVVLTPLQSKGLEFDAVLVVQPQEILDESGNGARDLYVALTRATQRVGIVHTGELPRMLGRARATAG